MFVWYGRDETKTTPGPYRYELCTFEIIIISLYSHVFFRATTPGSQPIALGSNLLTRRPARNRTPGRFIWLYLRLHVFHAQAVRSESNEVPDLRLGLSALDEICVNTY